MEIPSSEDNNNNNEIIKHVVLFNVKDEEDDHQDSKVNAMITALNNLDSVLYLTAGPILRTRSLPPSLSFTHLLHSRSLSRDHLSFLDSLLNPISDDVISLDWVGPESTSTRAGSGMRFILLKVEDVEEKEKVLEGFKKIQESLGPFVHMSYGEKFSEERGKGFSVAAVAVFPDLNELDASEEFEDQIRSLINKFKVSDDGIIAVDYVVPRPSSY